MRRIFWGLVCLNLATSGCQLPGATSTGRSVGTGERTVGSRVPVAELLRPGGTSGTVLANTTTLTGGDSTGVIAAGSGNIVSSNNAGIIAAGSGNLVAGNKTGIIAAGSGNIVSSNNAGIIAAGAGNLAQGPGAGFGLVANPGNLGPGGGGAAILTPVDTKTASTATATSTATLSGRLIGPAGLVGALDNLPPVSGAAVGLYDLTGKSYGVTTSSVAGGFTFDGLPTGKLFVVRARFVVAGQEYALSTLATLEGSSSNLDLTPTTTLAEAEFVTRCNGVLPADGIASLAFLQGFENATMAAGLKVPASVLLAADPQALSHRAAAYAQLVLAQPAAFATYNVDSLAYPGVATGGGGVLIGGAAVGVAGVAAVGP